MKKSFTQLINFFIEEKEGNMKKLLLVIPLVILLCFSFCCQQQGEEVAEDVGVVGLTDEDVTAIKKMLADQEPLLLAGDFEGYSQLFTEDVVIMAPNAPVMKGREAWLQFFAGLTVTAFNSNLLEVDGCDDIACGRGTISITFEVEGVSEPVSDSGKWVAIWRKQPNGKWLIAVDIWNSDHPLSE